MGKEREGQDKGGEEEEEKEEEEEEEEAYSAHGDRAPSGRAPRSKWQLLWVLQDLITAAREILN